jgi:proline iminopeptidase
MPSHYLTALAGLADERRVVLFDQLGCGRSDRPSDASLWSVERAVAEVDEVRRGLGLGRVHVLGHSWGGFLALAFYRALPEAARSLVLSSPLVSVAGWMADAHDLLSGLPAETRRAIERHEAAGTFQDPEYEAATMVFYRRHFCSLDPWPAALERTFAEMGEEVYRTMWGPSEFTQTGTLAGMDLTGSLDKIDVPSLWMCGTEDEVAPARLRRFAERARGAEMVFAGGTHCLHLEQTEAYVSAVRRFLSRGD